nr:FISUMP domain-containing protein [uncultured Draconibacterium sp.]
MPHVVAISQLQAMADYFTTANYPYFEELREAFKLLRLTGCRIQEIFQIERWSVIDGYNVQLQPQKFNNPRQITLNSDFDNFLAAIQNQYKPFLGRTYSQLENLFHKINPYGPIYSGSKYISNYFFRYLFVRELDADGKTPEQIAVIMGYTSPQAVNNYLSAPLSSTIIVPVVPKFIFDNVEYPVVNIGELSWIYTNFRGDDGEPGIFERSVTPELTEELGYFYRYDAAMRIASSLPDGWRLPSVDDFLYLASLFGGVSNCGPALKSTDLQFWNSPNGTNISKFNARGSGISQQGNESGTFGAAYFMTSTAPRVNTFNMFVLYDIYANVSYTNNWYQPNYFGSIRFCRDSE